MQWESARSAMCIFLVVVVTSCGCDTTYPTAQTGRKDAAPEYATFKESLEAGASCADLFKIRNAVDPKSPDIERMNGDLRSIGCYSPDSIRQTAKEPSFDERQPAVAASAGSTSGYSVKEYQMYRALMDTPMSVPEPQATQKVALQYGVTAGEVSATADKVVEILSHNNWYGSAESELRRASDWEPGQSN